jgi:hypothetical protein
MTDKPGMTFEELRERVIKTRISRDRQIAWDCPRSRATVLKVSEERHSYRSEDGELKLK